MWERLVSAFGGSVLGEVKELIQTFKLPPEVQVQAQTRLAELEHAFRTKVLEMDVADRASARQREAAVRDKTTAVLAYVIVGAFIAVGSFMIIHPYLWPDVKIEPEMLTLVGTIVGYLAAKAEQVASYYFGSSAGSAAKNDLIRGR